jgi:murein DD-endopeptidase MepM/ murein hydrolase activator NlpD
MDSLSLLLCRFSLCLLSLAVSLGGAVVQASETPDPLHQGTGPTSGLDLDAALSLANVKLPSPVIQSSQTLLSSSAFVPEHSSESLATVDQASRSSAASKQDQSVCPEPALSRIVRHRITAGETLDSIARHYDLIPATLMGLNPVLRGGQAPVGAEILIPPYNGIRVEVPAGKTWRDVAKTYHVRADVLFEVNGCQESPGVVFVPGVNWSPNPAATTTAAATNSPLSHYPLPAVASILTGYGWQVDPGVGEVVFHSGVNLDAVAGTPVLAAGAGTIAFSGEQQGSSGKLVVINHSQGLQTRYSQLATVSVRVGQQVQAGTQIGTVGSSGATTRPYLHFEVRSNSSLGWVAQDPGRYFHELSLARQLQR